MENVPHEKVFCCCRMFFIHHGIYLIVLHCLVQGTYGVGLVITSFYKPESGVANYTAIASNLCLIPTGIFLFWANIYESWKGATIACIIMVLVTVFNLATTLFYFIQYFNFKANSLLDKNLFWKNESSWVSSKDVPFTMWHGLTILLMSVNCLWFYYSFIVYKLSLYLRRKFLV